MERAEKPTPSKADSIESPEYEAAPEAASYYLDYWSEFADNHPDLLLKYTDFKKAVRATNKRLHHLDEEVRDNYDVTGQCYSNEVINWYYYLGSLNDLNGAEETLVRAGMIMERRSEEEDSSNHEQLLAGCMFHEAAVLLEHPSNNRWMDRALDHYETVINRTASNRLNLNHQNALRYSYDVLFQQLFDRSQYMGNGGKHDHSVLELQYERLQRAYIDDFKQISEAAFEKDSANKKHGDSLQTFKGEAFEWFSVLAYRHAMWLKNKLANTTIRSAFPREDSPWLATNSTTKVRSPKQGLDVVVTNYKNGTPITTEYKQLKSGGGDSNQYLPEIKPINAYSKNARQFIVQLNKAAELMGRQYSGEYLSKQNYETIREAFSFIEPGLFEEVA